MCTLTVITRDDGYLLGMNRDERLARATGLAPTMIELPSYSAIYPHDGSNGTWIAANDHGIALSLLNWNDVPQPMTEKARSRGEVIPALIACSTLHDVHSALRRLDLCGIWPFRLVGVSAEEKVIREWRWNQTELETQSHEWQSRHWFSSSMSDGQATAGRGAVCAAAWSEADAGSHLWLRRLHASHHNGPGPFSLCVHRESVGTLSYTEIECTPHAIELRYGSGSPCLTEAPMSTLHLERVLFSVA